MSREEELFAEALALPAAERAAYLAGACAGDASLHAQVQALLAGHAAMAQIRPLAPAGGFWNQPAERAGDVIGRYCLLELLGEGGCGSVWRAEQQQPVRRQVALKVIKLGMDTKEVIARFEAERQALALMDHPHIAKVFDAGATASGRPFFAMELVRGIPITRYCDDAALPVAARLNVFVDVCRAIQHAHERGVIHRDIKPSNILVAAGATGAAPKVIDFGVAKATQGRLAEATVFTALRQFIGTPAYMSPEQADLAGEIDCRSDLHALGALLYELLTGEPPFDPKELQRAGIEEVRRILREVEPLRPSARLAALAPAERAARAGRRGTNPAQLAAQVDGDLDWIVLRCLEKDRTRRYPSAQELALDLERHLRHEPVAARPPRLAYRAGKFIRRHRLVCTAAGAVALAIAAGVIVGVRQSRRADRAERTAAALQAPAATLDAKAIVVLPFENLSAEAEANAFFVDGVHEDVIAGLMRIPDLRCVPRPTAAAFRGTAKSLREIAGELQVAYLLTATVRRAGQNVRLVATLVDARLDRPVWVRTFERDQADVFAIRADLAGAIAAELKTAISQQTREMLQRAETGNPAAYELFLKAREIRNRGMAGYLPKVPVMPEVAFLQEQEALLQGAVTLDPGFAGAWAELAWIHCSTYYGFETTYKDRSTSRRALARVAIARALQLAPDSPNVVLSHGFYRQFCERDYAGAAAEFEKVAAQQPYAPAPRLALGQLRRSEGRWREALAHFRAAVEFDPFSAFARTELVVLLGAGRRFEERRAELRRMVDLFPGNLSFQAGLARSLYYATGDTREMEEYLQKTPIFLSRAAAQHEKFVDPALARWKSPPPLDPAMPYSWVQPLHVAVILAGRGRMAEARALLEHGPANLRARLTLDPDNPTLLCDLACIEAVLGHRAEALQAVERAVALTPLEVDHWHAPQVEENRAFVYAWTGDRTRAIELYTRLLRTPFVSPRLAEMTVHVMRHSLWFAPLRGDPRWEALLEEPGNQMPLF